jgi:hypothetical protein
MPNKHNSSRRHHIPKMKFQVKNWAEYDAGLRRRGSLTLDATIASVTADGAYDGMPTYDVVASQKKRSM